MIKCETQKRFRAVILALCLITTITMTAFSGCTGMTAGEETETEITITDEEIPTTPELTETISTADIIAIDLIVMDQDVQNRDPLAFSYEIVPTELTGKNDKGEYEFNGIIPVSNLKTGGDSNYLGVMFSENDDESESGYHAWVHDGFKLGMFTDGDQEDIIFEFTVKEEDIPDGRTTIMTGDKIYPISLIQ